MVATPFVAPYIGLNNPRSAVIFGGLIGTSSGVAGGLAATDPKLVPYGCLTAAFYTALGCLLGPSLLFRHARAARLSRSRRHLPSSATRPIGARLRSSRKVER